MDAELSDIQVTESQLVDALRAAFEKGSESEEIDADCLTFRELVELFEEQGFRVSEGRLRKELYALMKVERVIGVRAKRTSRWGERLSVKAYKFQNGEDKAALSDEN